MQAGEGAVELGDRVPVAGHSRDEARAIAEAYEPGFLDAASALVDGANQRVQAPRVLGSDGREYEVRLHPGWRETCRGGV